MGQGTSQRWQTALAGHCAHQHRAICKVGYSRGMEDDRRTSRKIH
jgi:hypothetical protein